MRSKDLVDKIKQNLPQLPLTFSYLGAVKATGESSNYHGISNKPDTIDKLQTNHDPVGFFFKQISRMIPPIAADILNGDGQPTSQEQVIEASEIVIDRNKYFTLFACCIPVKGASRSIICDVQRQHFNFIPNALYELLIACKHKTLAAIIEQYGQEHETVIAAYFTFLTQAEYGFWASADELAFFPPLDLSWASPLAVTNGIIDVDGNSTFDIKQVIAQLDELGCAALQLRCYTPKPLPFFDALLQFVNGSRIKSIDLLMPWHTGLEEKALVALAEQYLRLNNILVHSAPFNSFEGAINNSLSRVVFSTTVVTSEQHCGLVSPAYFALNLSAFSESLHFNSCLNRKISVDKSGNIKNCPALPEQFGNVADTKLKDALQQPGFKDKWHITKDDCAVCKDCEFRYICTDCRANTATPGNWLDKPAHCQYNPYTAEWEDEAAANTIQVPYMSVNENIG
jgi:SPASM domain peptide maturase of grasp-with-spasm system